MNLFNFAVIILFTLAVNIIKSSPSELVSASIWAYTEPTVEYMRACGMCLLCNHSAIKNLTDLLVFTGNQNCCCQDPFLPVCIKGKPNLCSCVKIENNDDHYGYHQYRRIDDDNDNDDTSNVDDDDIDDNIDERDEY